MAQYQVPISLNALVTVEAKDKDELYGKLYAEIQRALNEGRFDYQEWQLEVFEDEIDGV